MQKRFSTIRDYHQTDPDIRVEFAEFPSLRISRLHEGSGDVRFVRTAMNGLVLTEDGSAAHLTRMDGIDDDTPSRPGEICLIPGGVAVHLAWRNHAALQTSLMVDFDDALFQTYAPEVVTGRFARGHLVPSNFTHRPMLGTMVHLVATELYPRTRRGRIFAETAIRLMALELAANTWSQPSEPGRGRVGSDARILRALDFIEAHYADDISLLDISAAAGLSPAQFTVLFRQATGKSPYAYVIDRRLQQAVHLLRTTDLPIALVALEAGFGDQPHLTRLCRARLGRTPRAIRQD
ncbi:MAG: helix-turn-helix domain-containing protein [Gemmobacter sp.]